MKKEFKTQEEIQFFYDRLASLAGTRKGLHHNSAVLPGVGLVDTFQYGATIRSSFTDFYSESMRGIAFKMGASNKPTAILVHPYPKFFNWGESDIDTPPLPRSSVRKVTAKVDGSLGVAYSYGGELYLKSNSSYTAEEIALMETALEKDPMLKDLLTKITTGVFTNGELCTVMVEYVSRETTVIVGASDDGSDESFTITGIRINGDTKLLDLDTFPLGKYAVEDLTDKVDIYSDSLSETRDKLKDYSSGVEGVEGLVVELHDGRMFKVKTEWYLKRHAIHNIGYYDSLIVEAVLDNKIDDVLASYAERKERRDYIESIREKVTSYLEYVDSESERLSEIVKDMAPTDAFSYLKENKTVPLIRGIVMARYNGKYVDVDSLTHYHITRYYKTIIGDSK